VKLVFVEAAQNKHTTIVYSPVVPREGEQVALQLEEGMPCQYYTVLDIRYDYIFGVQPEHQIKTMPPHKEPMLNRVVITIRDNVYDSYIGL
jgi:hypothetical protein